MMMARDHGDKTSRSAGAADPEFHRVSSLPFMDAANVLTTPHYAGLLPASKDNKKYFFYWFFYPDTSGKEVAEEDIPLLLWLNGGPGCSSMDGLFLEHGPIQLTHDGQQWKIIPRPSSWHKTPAYVVYVDQPVGTGLSFTTNKRYPRNDEEVNIDFYYWLQQFFTLHKNVLLNPQGDTLRRPFFFSGESHAGHYIPSMMAYIDHQNDNLQPGQIRAPLSGAAIGNGWMDPYHQYAGAAAAYGHSVIDLAQKHALDKSEQKCQANLAKGNLAAGICFSLLDKIVLESQGEGSLYKVSQYDVTKLEPHRGGRTFPPGHKDVESYLGDLRAQGNSPAMPSGTTNAVLEALHATPSRQAGQIYRECTDPPYNALSHQDGKGVVEETKSLLESGKRMLFFNGVLDLICNHVGNEVFLENLKWKHQKEWIKAPRYGWGPASSKKRVAGYVKEFENLIFMKVLNSGHMVPLDVPEIALEMMQTFVFQRSFDSYLQQLDRAEEPAPISCPECPSCPAGSSTSNNPEATSPDKKGNSSDKEDNTKTAMVYGFVIAHSWVGAMVALAGVACVWVWIKRGRSSVTPAPAHSFSSVEMKQPSLPSQVPPANAYHNHPFASKS
eukprot:CAMPEP_0116865666 /NCGR_PEP_ID=MMETSP0418-20121206/25586_1 /TAXON_ID=1158023 /ORGANISM="Astrosyne radiata, Strain 13vi08-1A" /LENGTH=609 /DNA_ID=CAMNT_0004501187 /DNA_START=79 /DNA_END=1905 /DNA_ORIENTATION=+